MALVRLQKVMAAGGVGSRRHCEELIAQGRVTVDGESVTRQGLRVDPGEVLVRVDGRRVVAPTQHRYVALNKVAGMVSTMSDELGRPSLGDLAIARQHRLFHVGRLDADSEGLLLLTDDGVAAHRLTHPSHGIPKTYVATIKGSLPASALRQLRKGVMLEDGPASVDAVRILDRAGGRSLVELTVHEGRNRLIRRLLDAVEHPVLRLVRTEFGPVRLGTLRAGRTRLLTRAEVGSLLDLIDESPRQ